MASCRIFVGGNVTNIYNKSRAVPLRITILIYNKPISAPVFLIFMHNTRVYWKFHISIWILKLKLSENPIISLPFTKNYTSFNRLIFSMLLLYCTLWVYKLIRMMGIIEWLKVEEESINSNWNALSKAINSELDPILVIKGPRVLMQSRLLHIYQARRRGAGLQLQRACILKRISTHFSAAAAEHGCCTATTASRRRELRLMTDVAESCAPFPLQLHHAHLQLHLLPLPLPLTDTDSTTVLDAHVFSPLHEFGASCPLPEIHPSINISESLNDSYKTEGLVKSILQENWLINTDSIEGVLPSGCTIPNIVSFSR